LLFPPPSLSVCATYISLNLSRRRAGPQQEKTSQPLFIEEKKTKHQVAQKFPCFTHHTNTHTHTHTHTQAQHHSTQPTHTNPHTTTQPTHTYTHTHPHSHTHIKKFLFVTVEKNTTAVIPPPKACHDACGVQKCGLL